MSRIGRPAGAVLITLAAGFVLSAAVAFWQHHLNEERAAATFQAKSQQVVQLVTERMQSYERGLRGARGIAVFSNGYVDRMGFARYGESRDVDREFPGARGFGLIWRVPEYREAEFVANAKRDVWPGFSVRQLEPHAGERYVIQYIEPIERNRPAVGLDIASERKRREAAQVAMRTGQATLTEPITLVQASGKPSRSFLLLLPIYRSGAALTTPQQRESACIGWSYAPLVIDDVLNALDTQTQWYTLSLRDTQAADGAAFYSQAGHDAAANALRRQLPIEVFGRTWAAELQATPAFVASLHQTTPALAASVTAVISSLCAMLVGLLASLAARKEKARVEQARRASIVDASDDAIVGADPEGVITDWNAGAERLFGHLAAEAIGRNVGDLLLPTEELRAEEADIQRAVKRGERTPPFESRRRHCSGELIDVSISAAPILAADGRCVGYSKTLRDIREAKRAKQALADLNADLENKVTERTSMLDRARRDLQNILDAVPSMIGYWDRQLTNRVANHAYSQWFGVDPHALQGTHMRALLGDDIFERNRPHVEAVLRGEAQTFERSYPRPDGQGERHSLAHYLPDVIDGEVQGFYVLVHDVTELVEGRLRLAAVQRDSEALLRTLNEHMIVSVADPSGRVTAVNEGFCASSGYSRDELLGQDHRLLNSGHHDRAFWVEMWRTISSGQSWRGEVCNRAKDGSLYWVNSLVAPFVGADGRIEKYISIRNDITPIKQAQQQAELARRDAEAAEKFLRDVTDKLPMRIAYVDDQLRFRFVNESLCQYFGRAREQVLGHQWDELTGAPLPAPLMRLVETVLQGASRSFEAEEHGRTFETRLVANRGQDGRVAGLFAVSADITERKQSETELRRTLALLRSVLEASTQVAIIAVTPDGKISMFNRGAEQLLGYTEAEVVGHETSLKFHDPDEMRQRAAVLTRELGHKVHTGLVLVEPAVMNQQHEWTYIRRDGVRVPVSLAVTAMHDDEGELLGYLGVAHDISARIQYEVSLREALQKARSASQAKSQFLANMSHEIRTPMNAVIGLTYLLARTALDAEQADTLAKIRIAGQSLLTIINDVLDLSKIEASEMQIERAPFVLATLLSEVASLSRLQADAKGVSFEVRASPELPHAVLGDATRLRQILTNLLSNAIKFTERGGVQLTVKTMPTTGERARLRFEVKDSGVGIAPDALAKLFAPFVQADTSTTRRFGGTGLGLSIVKQLATLMGGEVGVNSAPQLGSEFWVEFEFDLCDEAAAATLTQPGFAHAGPGLVGVRVLVADDNPINLEVARRILELEGARVWLAGNGQEAVERLAAEPQGVDVVLMDVQMPVLDGHDATRRIRGLGLAHLPIIALTAGITTGEHDRARAAGMNDVVAKPFDPPALVRCIRQYVQAGVQVPPAPPVHRAVAPAWPQIEGLDASDVRARLGGDVALLGSLLKMLLDNFADIGTELTGHDTATLAARLHNLKGSAGTLGAKSLERVAAQAEQACRADQPEQFKELAQQLVSELAALRRASAPVLETQATEDDGQALPGGLDSVALATLLEQLRHCDLAAVDGFKALAPHLRPLLGPQAFAAVRQHVDNLQFDLVADTLQGIEAERTPRLQT